MGRFYFDANLTSAKDFIRGIPMFAVHAGQTYTSYWDTSDAEDFVDLQNIVAKVNPQVPVHLAMPRLYADHHFPKGAIWEKVAVTACRPMPGASWQPDGGYRAGGNIVMVIQNMAVTAVTPIPQFKGLPIPPAVQKNYLERQIGMQAYSAVAVSLWAQTANIF